MRTTHILLLIALSAAATGFATGVQAQTQAETETQSPASTSTSTQSPDDLSRRLEVTRAYTPKVEQAEKLPVEPNMVDTVRLRPQIAYRIVPTAWPAAFSVDRFAPASIGVAAWEPSKAFYVRLGAGLPFQTTADVYFTPRMKPGRTFGIFATHRGSWAGIKNDLGIKADAASEHHSIGLWGSTFVGSKGRYTLSGDVSYDIRGNEFYGAGGATLPQIEALSTPARTHLDYYKLYMHRASGNIGFGDTFTDLSHFNFRVALSPGYSMVDGTGVQADLDFEARVAMMPHPEHGFEVTFTERGMFDLIPRTNEGSPSPEGGALAVILAPRYVIERGRFRFKAGLDLSYIGNKAFDQNRFGIMPALDASFDFADGAFVPFIAFSSTLLDGGHEALSRRNPYVNWQLGGDPSRQRGATGWTHDLRLGFAGNVGDVFTYKLSGGMSLLRDYHIFMAVQRIAIEEDTVNDRRDVYYQPLHFDVSSAHGVRYTVGTELGVGNLGGFSASLHANWNWFDFDDDISVGDLPRYDVGLEAGYRHKDKFSVTAGANLLGDRLYNIVYRFDDGTTEPLPGYEPYATTGRLRPTVDVSLAAEAKIVQDFWVFLEGRNLANRKLYPWPGYRGLGINVMAGVKLTF